MARYAASCFWLPLLLLPLAAGAQESGSITGRVTSPSGSPVRAAAIVLELPGGPQQTTTDDEGRFVFRPVQPGTYRLTVTATAFSPLVQVVRVSAATPPDLTIALPALVSERVNVVGDPGLVGRIPGAAHVIARKEMEALRLATDDIHQMLRQVPGLNLQEEEGYGLRPNIGIRGTGSDRSSKITMMEDGVLIAPAPYSAPAAYYAPISGRMESIEVRKGSSQIKYGPITTGGVLNYVSTSVPSDFTVRSTVSGGGNSTRKISAHVGDSAGGFGWLLETFQLRNNGFKRLDGGGDTGVDLGDYLGKVKFNTTPTTTGYQEVEIKLGRTEQTGDETYLGLTDDDFGRTPLRRYAGSQVDRFESTHTQYQARHLYARRTWDLTTVVYRNNFARAWYKLESVLGGSLSSVLASPGANAARLAVLQGGESAPNALVVRDNNRTYFGAGVQSVLGVARVTGRFRHQFEAGVRYHRDEEDRFQHDDAYQMVSGRMVLTRSGAPGSQTNQVVGARAVAGFVADTIAWGRWSVSPGLRYEHIDLTRDTYLLTDPNRAGRPAVLETAVSAFIPGIGVSYAANPGLTIFGGAHRGFAPPGPGAAAGTRVENSVNYEIGTRLQRASLEAELVGFFNDYSNLLGRDSLATGGSGDGEIFNGGRAQVAGFEASARWNVAPAWGLASSLPVRVAYSFSHAEFRNSFQSQFGPWGNVRVGDALPYVPSHQLSASIETDHRTWRARVDTFYVARMRTLAGQGAYDPARSTDAYAVVNLSGEYRLRPGASVFASVQNVADSVHIVSRHPAGVRPGLPRLFQVGLKLGYGGL